MDKIKIIYNDPNTDTSIEFDIQYFPTEYSICDYIDISAVIFSNLEMYSGCFELPSDMNSDCFDTTQSVYDMLMDCLNHQNEDQLKCYFDIDDNYFSIVIKYGSKYMSDTLRINLQRVKPSTREKTLEKKVKTLTSNMNMLENLIAPMLRELSIIKNNELVYIPEPDDSMTKGKPLQYIRKYLGIDILTGIGRPFSFSEVTDIWIVPNNLINTKAVYDKTLDRYYQETCPNKREQRQNINITFAEWKKTPEARNVIIENIKRLPANGIIKDASGYIVIFSTDDNILYSVNDYMFAEYVYVYNSYSNCVIGYNHQPVCNNYIRCSMTHTLKLLILILHKFTNLKYLYSSLPFSDISDKNEFIRRIEMISSLEEYIIPGK